MKKIRLCVIFGGASPEHEVSLRSGETVINAVDRERFELFTVGITRDGRWLLYSGPASALPDSSWEKHPDNVPAFIPPDRSVHGLVILRGGNYELCRLDCVFPIMHGENGEDGSMQGLMQLAGIPCAGAGVGASAASMDKTLTKLVVSTTEVRQADYIIARSYEGEEHARAAVEAKFTYPVFVKPAGTGSSVGITKVKSSEALIPALRLAWSYDEKALVEEFIEGHEIECAVLGNREPVAFGIAEIIPGAEFYDYNEKYINDTTVCKIPAELPEEWTDDVCRAALTVYRAIGCRGLARVDFFVKYDGTVIFNELNTLPGFTSISMYPQLLAHAGVSNTELVTRIAELASEESGEERV